MRAYHKIKHTTFSIIIRTIANKLDISDNGLSSISHYVGRKSTLVNTMTMHNEAIQDPKMLEQVKTAARYCDIIADKVTNVKAISIGTFDGEVCITLHLRHIKSPDKRAKQILRLFKSYDSLQERIVANRPYYLQAIVDGNIKLMIQWRDRQYLINLRDAIPQAQ